MKKIRIQRDVLLLFAICVLILLPTAVILNSRVSTTNSLLHPSPYTAQISPDGKYIAATEPSRFGDAHIPDNVDLVIRVLNDQVERNGEEKIRMLASSTKPSWSDDGSTILMDGRLYDFTGGTTLIKEEAWRGEDLPPRTTLALNAIPIVNQPISNSFILPDSDLFIWSKFSKLSKGVVWNAQKISTRAPIPLAGSGQQLLRKNTTRMRIQLRPLSDAQKALATIPVHLALRYDILSPAPTPTPIGAPTPTPSPEQIKAQKREYERHNELTTAVAKLNAMEDRSSEEAIELEEQIARLQDPFESMPGVPPPGFFFPVTIATDVELYDLRNNKPLWRRRFHFPERFRSPSLLWSGDGTMLALIGTFNPRNGKKDQRPQHGIEILDGNSGKTISFWNREASYDDQRKILFLPSENGNRWSVMAGPDPNFQFFDALTGRKTAEWSAEAIRKSGLDPLEWATNNSGTYWAFGTTENGMFRWKKFTRQTIEAKLVATPK